MSTLQLPPPPNTPKPIMQPHLSHNQTIQIFNDIPVEPSSKHNQILKSYRIRTMQNPPKKPFQNLNEQEKHVLDLWASQQDANIKLAKMLCRNVLQTSQKALLEKAGMSMIHERGQKFCKLAPMTTFLVNEHSDYFQTGYPFAGFANVSLPTITFFRLKACFLYSGKPVDGNTFFWGLHNLTIKTLSFTRDYNDDPTWVRFVIGNGLGSLATIQSLEELINCDFIGEQVFKEVNELPSLKKLHTNLEWKEICLLFATLNHPKIQELRIGFNHLEEAALHSVTDDEIWEAVATFKQRNPKIEIVNFNYRSQGSEFERRFMHQLGKVMHLPGYPEHNN